MPVPTSDQTQKKLIRVNDSFESSQPVSEIPLRYNGVNKESSFDSGSDLDVTSSEATSDQSATSDTSQAVTSTESSSSMSSEAMPYSPTTSPSYYSANNGSSPILIKVSPASPNGGVPTPPQRSGEASSDEEEYFEEFNLPNTGENAFVRHQSFRRKVKLTEIDAPDADRIEGLVRSNGDFRRHGSLRKKIFPGEDILEEFDPDSTDSFTENIREIESMIEASDESTLDSSQSLGLPATVEVSRSSTPNLTKVNDDSPPELNISECGIEPFDSNDQSLEQVTMKKIKACLDYSNYSDIYNLSGRLQDILSPIEIEEVVSNQERYRSVINEEVLEFLSLSFSTHDTSRGNETANTDSGFSSPKPPADGSGPVAENREPSRLSFVETSGCFQDEEMDEVAGEFRAQDPPRLKKIPAPVINFDSSSDIDFDINTSEDQERLKNSQDKSEAKQKKKIILDATLLTSSSLDDNSTEYFTSSDPGKRLNETAASTGSEISQAEEASQYFDSLPLPPQPEDLIPELSAAEELAEERHWRNVVIAGAWRRIDMKAIGPYRKCITHGGYTEEEKIPVVVISAPLLPEKSRSDYNYVMDNLFMYVLSYLEHLASEDYILVYLAGGKLKDREPGFVWMKAAYQMIDRRLRKNLKQLMVVHPTIWARTLIALSRPFISSKFYRKLRIVYNLTELAQLVPLDQLEIPEIIKQIDFEMMIKSKKRNQVNRW